MFNKLFGKTESKYDEALVKEAIANLHMAGYVRPHNSAIQQEIDRLISNRKSTVHPGYLNRPSTAGRKQG